MDFFTTNYKKRLEDKAQKEQELQQNAREIAVAFFKAKFPDLSDKLIEEGYEIAGGRVSDFCEDGFPGHYTCSGIEIKKGSRNTYFGLLDSEYRDFCEAFSCEETHEVQAIDGIPEYFFDLIGKAFYQEPTKSYQEISPAPDVYNRTYFAALAMNGLIASYAGHIRPSPDEIARNAYLIADAMQKLS